MLLKSKVEKKKTEPDQPVNAEAVETET